ncbi:hypothetical protein [Pseudoxanthomonas winnipegensis]|nr:hypothetical protein [Pseudoxanthomonas winnipegensis]
MTSYFLAYVVLIQGAPSSADNKDFLHADVEALVAAGLGRRRIL